MEVSTDGGKTWSDAYIKPKLSDTAWVVWGYAWIPVVGPLIGGTIGALIYHWAWPS